MERNKSFLLGGLMLALIMLIQIPTVLSATPEDPGIRQKARSTRLMGMRELVRGLNLSDEQKTEIRNILAENKARILQVRRDIVKARLDLNKGVSNVTTELANALQQAANLKIQIQGQIKALLNPDQIAKVQEKQLQGQQRLQRKLDRLNGKIGG